jgi:hypothetical protein
MNFNYWMRQTFWDPSTFCQTSQFLEISTSTTLQIELSHILNVIMHQYIHSIAKFGMNDSLSVAVMIFVSNRTSLIDVAIVQRVDLNKINTPIRTYSQHQTKSRFGMNGTVRTCIIVSGLVNPQEMKQIFVIWMYWTLFPSVCIGLDWRQTWTEWILIIDRKAEGFRRRDDNIAFRVDRIERDDRGMTSAIDLLVLYNPMAFIWHRWLHSSSHRGRNRGMPDLGYVNIREPVGSERVFDSFLSSLASLHISSYIVGTNWTTVIKAPSFPWIPCECFEVWQRGRMWSEVIVISSFDNTIQEDEELNQSVKRSV